MKNAAIKESLRHCTPRAPIWGCVGAETGPLLLGERQQTVEGLLSDQGPPEGVMSLTAHEFEVVRIELRPEGVVLVADPGMSHKDKTEELWSILRGEQDED